MDQLYPADFKQKEYGQDRNLEVFLHKSVNLNFLQEDISRSQIPVSSLSSDAEMALEASYQAKTREGKDESVVKAREVAHDRTPAVLGCAVLDRDLPGTRLEKRPLDGYENMEIVPFSMRKYQHAWVLRNNDSLMMDIFRQAVLCECYSFKSILSPFSNCSPCHTLFHRETPSS
jgi:hypothetical protein